MAGLRKQLGHRCSPAVLEQDGDITRFIGDEHAVGIGITTRTSSMGEVGNPYKDFTAIGPVVNLASRLPSVARPGEIMITEEVCQRMQLDLPPLPFRTLALKGIDVPVKSYVSGAEVMDGKVTA